MKKIIYLSSILFSLLLANCTQSQNRNNSSSPANKGGTEQNKYPDPKVVSGNARFPMQLSESDWKKN